MLKTKYREVNHSRRHVCLPTSSVLLPDSDWTSAVAINAVFQMYINQNTKT